MLQEMHLVTLFHATRMWNTPTQISLQSNDESYIGLRNKKGQRAVAYLIQSIEFLEMLSRIFKFWGKRF